MDSKKTENIIIERLLFSGEVNLDNISDRELKTFIKEKIVEANYLKEGWQIHYAIERISKEIKLRHKPNLQKSDKRGEILGVLTNFSISVLFYSIIRFWLFPFLIISGLESVIVLGIIYFLVTKIKNSLRGKEILYNVLVALVIFPFLAVNIGKFIKTYSAWLVLPLAILAYILAKSGRIIFKKGLTYVKR